MSEHTHAHEHAHEHAHKLSVYEFLGRILAEPLDETLRFNVCDPEFWNDLRPKLSNLRTMGALNAIEKAVSRLGEVPPEELEKVLAGEYEQMFCGDEPFMPPCEQAYGMQISDIHAFAREFGVTSLLPSALPHDHFAAELLMLAPIDEGGQLTRKQLITLACFFESHPMALAQNMLDAAAGKEDPTSGFYQGIVRFSLAWLRYDLDAFEE